MTYVLWQAAPGDTREGHVHVRGADEQGVPPRLDILASVSEEESLVLGSRSYIQLSIPGVGPALAWVGVPGGGHRDGHFVHPATGRTWPWGQLVHAVKHAVEHAGSIY